MLSTNDLWTRKGPLVTSRPNLEETVPTACAEGHAVAAHAQAANAILVSSKNTYTFSFERVPDVAVVVVVACEQNSA